MTQQEQADNERIAELLEPSIGLPELPKHYFVIVPYRSPKGCWVAQGHSGVCGAWEPANFHADESANAILRDAMAARNAYVWIEWDINEWCVSVLPTTAEDQDASTEINHRDYKRAIVGAFLKFMEVSK